MHQKKPQTNNKMTHWSYNTIPEEVELGHEAFEPDLRRLRRAHHRQCREYKKTDQMPAETTIDTQLCSHQTVLPYPNNTYIFLIQLSARQVFAKTAMRL